MSSKIDPIFPIFFFYRAFILDLKTFLKNAIKTADNIRAFVQSGGNTIEIVEAIKNNEESSVEVVSSLYQMLRLVISHIIDNGQQMQEPMIQALKCMVHRNKRSIERMLSSKTSDKVLMMKILSIAVNLDGEIGRDVLKNIDVFAKSSDNFTVLEDHQKKKPSYESSTRLAFVHFILAFLLSEKDVILRKKIIQKRALFEFFLRDLHSDNFETIKSVITCLTKNVLISTSFSKPEKLKIFTDNAVRSVLKLYEWKNNVVEKESVCTIAHQFLLLLLTSKKHGIVFKALSEKRQNLRQLQVINTFKTVWNAEYPAMLVIEIIKSCPDLMQIVLNRLVLGLQPKITTDWFMCINFTRELIKALEPSLMFKYFYMLEPKKVSANIIKFSISQFILQNLNERSLIQQENLEIREKATEVIRLQLEQCCKYLNEIRNCEALQDFEKHRIKFDIINHILTFFPNIDVILNSLYRSINLSVSMKASQENENLVKSQLKHTLEILLLLIHNFPSVIEKIPSVIDYLEVLRPIYQYQLSSSSDIDENEDLLIELKVVKIILFLQPSILSLDSEMFNRIFLVLIQVYSCSEINELKNESKFLLTGILQNTQIFPSADSLEISLWLEAFKSVKRGILKESAIVFVLALRSIKTCGFKATNLSSKIIEKCGLNLLKKIDASNESEQSNICAAELSSVLPALISMSSNKINRVIDFLEVSIILLYHSHPQLKSSFVDLLKSDQIELNTKIVNYIQRKSLCDFGEVLEVCEDLIYRQFQRAIIDRKKIEIHVNDVQQLEFLIIQAMFCAVQLEESEQLDLKNVTLLNEYIREFYLKILETEHNDSIIFNDASRISVETDEPKKVNKICELKTVRPSEVVIRYIFEHQKIFLEKFSLSNAGQITSFIIGLSDTFRANELFDTVTKTFKTKIVAEINQSLKQTHHDGILDIVEKFSLDSDSCHSILNAIFKQNITAKKFHINLISFVINQLTQLRSHPLSVKQIQKIEKIYIETVENTAIELFSLESALLEYFKMFNHNIGDLSKIFLTVFREDQAATKSFLLLMNFIFKHSTNWDEDFRNNAAKLKKELLYPLLDVALEKGIIATDKLKPIYQEFKSGIAKAIDKPNKAAQIYRENIHTSVKLIVMVMPINECQDMAMKKFKFEATEIYQLKMMQAIFIKARNTNQEQDGRIFANFINHWLHLFYIYVEKPSATSSTGEYEKILEQWLDMKKVAESPDDHLNTKHWENFYKICLTNGLKAVGDSSMLLVLAKFIRAVNVNLDDVATIFDMILTHSNFFNIVFNYKPSTRKLRRDLFYLLNIVVQKNPSIANEKHIPIFLSSYQASMASYDQLILNLLRFYELRCKIDMYDYRPFLFGPAALHHFTSNEDDDVKLMKKNIDDTTNVFMKLISLFEKTMIENSVNNYPIKRQLAGIAADELDQLLKDSELEMSNVYDPGYFLPLFEMIFSASSFDFTSFAIKNNLMSLIFPALSCEDENMRLLAARILMKCRESTESKK